MNFVGTLRFLLLYGYRKNLKMTGLEIYNLYTLLPGIRIKRFHGGLASGFFNLSEWLTIDAISVPSLI